MQLETGHDRHPEASRIGAQSLWKDLRCPRQLLLRCPTSPIRQLLLHCSRQLLLRCSTSPILGLVPRASGNCSCIALPRASGNCSCIALGNCSCVALPRPSGNCSCIALPRASKPSPWARHGLVPRASGNCSCIALGNCSCVALPRPSLGSYLGQPCPRHALAMPLLCVVTWSELEMQRLVDLIACPGHSTK